MHDLASNNKHSHGVEGSETEDIYFSATVLCRSVFTVTVVSSEPKVVVMYTMNNHTYDAIL